MKNNTSLQVYELSGGGKVTVYKPFGASKYFGIVEQNGVYPLEGHVAVNSGRSELSLVLDGQFTYEVDRKCACLHTGDSIFVPDKSSYKIFGKGMILVLVEDREGGATIIKKAFEANTQSD